MINEVAAAYFHAAKVCIEAPGWNNARERHKFSERVDAGIVLEK